ncbi:unnamed protein product, partial [Chrysoparadoxa australica]
KKGKGWVLTSSGGFTVITVSSCDSNAHFVDLVNRCNHESCGQGSSGSKKRGGLGPGLLGSGKSRMGPVSSCPIRKGLAAAAVQPLHHNAGSHAIIHGRNTSNLKRPLRQQAPSPAHPASELDGIFATNLRCEL